MGPVLLAPGCGGGGMHMIACVIKIDVEWADPRADIRQTQLYGQRKEAEQERRVKRGDTTLVFAREITPARARG